MICAINPSPPIRSSTKSTTLVPASRCTFTSRVTRSGSANVSYAFSEVEPIRAAKVIELRQNAAPGPGSLFRHRGGKPVTFRETTALLGPDLMWRVVTEHVSRPHGEKVRHKRDVSSVPRVTAPSRNCTNSHPKDRLSFGYCGPVIRVIVSAQLIGREVYDIQQRAAPRLGAAAVERELHRETVALACADWPEQIAHDAIAFHG